MLHQALCIISKPLENSNWSHNPETLNSGGNRQFFATCDFAITTMALTNYRAPLLHCVKLFASFRRHQLIQTGVTVRNTQFGKTRRIFVACELEMFQMTIECIFYAMSRFVHHFVGISELKLELRSEKAQFG